MGFTPLEGLMMGSRCGSIDPSILLHVQQHRGLTPQEVETVLNHESGLLGVSGVSADMRVVLKSAGEGDAASQLAVATYAHRVRQSIGALAATLGGIDALVFTAGVGENASEVRASICRGLEFMGLKLDHLLNAECRPDADVSVRNCLARILVIKTREEMTMFREVLKVLATTS
jgi:acetate kinase